MWKWIKKSRTEFVPPVTMNLNNITENPFFPHMFPVLEAVKLVCYPCVADTRKGEVVRERSGSQEH